jgi:DHA1 family bicyclomycin/chloramphenicol resistance-like MFS transporter
MPVSSSARSVPLVLMVLLLFATQACTDIFLPGLPAMARDFGIPMHVANRTISVYNYSQAAVVLFIGVVSDLYGRRRTVLACLALHVLASCWIAQCASFPWIVAMRAVQAAGSAAVYIVLRLAIKDTLDQRAQVQATGLLAMGLVLSPILAPVAGAAIMQWTSWRGCFWALAMVEAPLLLWAWYAIPETNHRQAALRAAFSWPRHFRHYGAVLADRYFLGMALIVGSAFAAFYAFISISSFLYIGQYHVQAGSYATVFIGIAMAYLAGNRLMSWLNARAMAPRRIVGIGIAVSCLGTAVVGASLLTQTPASGLVAVTLGACLLRFATALINPPAQVAVTNHFQDQSAHALGLLTCIQYAFAAAGTMLVSGLAYLPTVSFTVGTAWFVALAAVGYGWAYGRTILHND